MLLASVLLPVAVLTQGSAPQVAKQRQALKASRQAIICVAFSPDGRMVAAGGIDQSIWLWEVSTGKLRAQLEGHHGYIQAVAFSPDGRTLASACNDCTIKLWD
jgi:WD40 repeat protein